MRDVVVRDVVQEEAALPSEEGAVDRAGRAALEGPGALAIVREALVSVVELLCYCVVRFGIRIGIGIAYCISDSWLAIHWRRAIISSS